MAKTQTNPNSLANLRPFKKGIGGNPSGKSKAQALVEKRCRAAGPEVVAALLELTKHDDPRVRLEACKQVLDRGFGRAKQQSEHHGTVQHQITVNAAHLEAVRNISRQPLPPPAEDATLIEAEPVATPMSTESADASKAAYAERKRAEG